MKVWEVKLVALVVLASFWSASAQGAKLESLSLVKYLTGWTKSSRNLNSDGNDPRSGLIASRHESWFYGATEWRMSARQFESRAKMIEWQEQRNRTSNRGFDAFRRNPRLSRESEEYVFEDKIIVGKYLISHSWHDHGSMKRRYPGVKSFPVKSRVALERRIRLGLLQEVRTLSKARK